MVASKIDRPVFRFSTSLHTIMTMATRLSVYRQGEKVSAMGKISDHVWAVVICGCGGERD